MIVQLDFVTPREPFGQIATANSSIGSIKVRAIERLLSVPFWDTAN